MDKAEKPDLMAYLEGLEDVADPFENISPEEPETAPQEEQEAVEITEAGLLAKYVRMRSQGSQLACRSVFAAELGWDETIDVDQVAAEMMADPANGDLRLRKGTKNDYYYSINFMSDNFAMIAALVLDKDIPRTIGDMVRFNEKTYHHPTAAAKFSLYPYNFTKVQVEQAIAALQRMAEHQDIGVITTGNQKTYLYHKIAAMPEKLAKALGEENEKDEFGRYL